MTQRVLVAVVDLFGWVPSGWSATVTVPANAPTINAALELLDYDDGDDDLVVVGPGF